MNDTAPIGADAILAIPDDRPGFLFSQDADLRTAEYRALIKQWHPDAGCSDPRAGDIIAKITKLRDLADETADTAGIWFRPSGVIVSGSDSRTRTIRFRKWFRTDLGETVYGETVIALFVKPEFSGLFADGLRTIGNLTYPTHEIRREVERYMPKVRANFEARGGTMVLVLEKTPDVFRLRDVIAALGGKIEPRHVAWVMSTALNIACYLERAKLTHNAISPDSYYISPKHHAGLLLRTTPRARSGLAGRQTSQHYR